MVNGGDLSKSLRFVLGEHSILAITVLKINDIFGTYVVILTRSHVYDHDFNIFPSTLHRLTTLETLSPLGRL